MFSLPAKQLTVLALVFSTASSFPQLTTTPDHPSVPTVSIPPLPTQFSDIPDDALKCWHSAIEYVFTRNWLNTEFAKSSTRVVTTFSPLRTYYSTYSYTAATDCKTTPFGTSTLCDSVPRAASLEISCRTVTATATIEIMQYQSDITVITPTWTSEYDKPYPTCGGALYLSPACSRLFDAWSAMRSARPSPTDGNSLSYHLTMPPCTPLTNVPAPTDRPLCRISAATYSAYYWPQPTASGPDFCSLNFTAPTGTPTIPGKANTAMVSGHTLTSPSVYHFLQDVRVSTYRGQAFRPSGIDGFPQEIWDLWASVTRPLTVAQAETDILVASKQCIGREGDYCTLSLDADFRIQDLATVRKDVYEKDCIGCLEDDKGILYQAKYRPTLAIPVSEVVSQNGGVFADCAWDLIEWNDEASWPAYTSSDVAVVVVSRGLSTAFTPVATTSVKSETRGTAVVVPGLTFTTPSPTGRGGYGF